VDEHVATGCEQLPADRQADALGACGYKGAFALEFVHEKVCSLLE
jgi:hypothetical protein